MNRYATLRQLGRVEFGRMRADERGLVLASWTQSVVDGMGHGPRSGSKHRHHYLVSVGRTVDDLFAESTVLVARDADCAALAYGWIAGSGDCVHWCFSKGAYRRMGVAAHLFEALKVELGELTTYTLRSRHGALAERAGLRYADSRGKAAG